MEERKTVEGRKKRKIKEGEERKGKAGKKIGRKERKEKI